MTARTLHLRSEAFKKLCVGRRHDLLGIGSDERGSDLARFSHVTLGHSCGPGPIVEIHGPEPREVGQFEALQMEAVLILRDRYLMKYLHTVISGERGFHQVIAWTPPSTYDRRLFEQLIDGFRERLGPKPIPTLLPTDDRSSSYGVH